MIRHHLLIALAAASLVATPAIAGEATQKTDAAQADTPISDASIPFADHGGVRDWRADGRDAVYIEDVHKRWYRAELFAPAFDLPFVQFIGIDAGPSGTLDKFGAIYVAGERYAFRNFTRVADPTMPG
jgi:hypothetical protein